jgi:hypothetical protein
MIQFGLVLWWSSALCLTIMPKISASYALIPFDVGAALPFLSLFVSSLVRKVNLLAPHMNTNGTTV